MLNRFVLLIMLMAPMAWAEEPDDVSEISAACAALISIVALKSKPPFKEPLFAEARWFATMTTLSLVEDKMNELQEVLNNDWDNVWPIIVEAAEACSQTRREVLNNADQ